MKRALMGVLFRTVYLVGKPWRDGGITILSYHSLDDYGTGISVPPRLFETQMATLAAEGCRTLTMSQVAEHLQARRPLPPRAVAITFDDGFASVGTIAAPILARYGLTATVYVITGMIGQTTHWTAYGATLPALPLLDWPGIKTLHAQGIEIGAHTVTHGFLTRYPSAALARELQEPPAVLERELGQPARAFAYPQGDYNAAVVAAVRAAGYSTATTLDQGRAARRADPLRLPRLHVGPNTTPPVLRAFTVPAVGPTYQLINLAIRGVLGRKTWPRPNPAYVDSTQTLPLPERP